MKYIQKNIIATIYLKEGELVNSFEDNTSTGDLYERIRLFNDNGIDKIIVFDLSDDDAEHEQNLHALKEITRISELPVYAGGNINRLEDIKKILYAGCKKAILNTIKPIMVELAKEGAGRFGKEKLALSIYNVDLFFKQKSEIENTISELVVLNRKLVGTLADVTEMPYVVLADAIGYRASDDTSAWNTPSGYEKIASILSAEKTVRGISTRFFRQPDANVESLKKYLAERGITTGHLRAELAWSDFKLNSEGLIPVITQDYKTNEVLMLAYMNEEAFHTTIAIGKMTYYSRSRQELWTKGVTSGHFQYVKSLAIDCDRDTILAKVSQVGAACHTGNPTCFFTDLVKGDYTELNPLKVFEHEYSIILDRKNHPKDGSYTNYLFDKGLDKILKKMGEEATEIVIAAKNPEPEEIKYEIVDFLYHMMVMMVEKGITWDEVLEEMAKR